MVRKELDESNSQGLVDMYITHEAANRRLAAPGFAYTPAAAS